MIDRCHPYFIGIVGERYGYVSDKIDAELLDKQGWIKKQTDKSITELEIIHGVLNHPKNKVHAFFYQRAKEVSLKIEEELKKTDKGFKSEPVGHKTKLNALRKAVQECGYPMEGYQNPGDLRQMIQDDLWGVIDKSFPKSEIPTQLEQIRLDHEAFAAAKRKVYIGRGEYFKKLDEYANSDEVLPLVLLGESGSGKSALLANWTKEYRNTHNNDLLVCHYIGSTPNSVDHIDMLRRIMEEIKNVFTSKVIDKNDNHRYFKRKSDMDIPTDPIRLVEDFPLWQIGRAHV